MVVKHFYGMTMNDIGKGAHVIKHSCRMCVVGVFDKNLHGVCIWTRQKSVLYFILCKSIFLHFVHHGTKCYDRYINYYDRNIYIDDDGSGVLPEQKLRKIYNANYLSTYDSRSYILSKGYIKDTSIRQVYSWERKCHRFCAY